METDKKQAGKTSETHSGEKPAKLTIIEPFLIKGLTAYVLYMDDGSSIALPPAGFATVQQIQEGDEFQLNPMIINFRGETKKSKDITAVTVIRDKKFLLRFNVANNHIDNPPTPKPTAQA